MRKKIKKIKQGISKRATALSLAVLMGFAAISPHVIQAFPVGTDGTLDTHPDVWPTWQPDKIPTADDLFKNEYFTFSTSATGMFFNQNQYFSVKNAGYKWPLGAAMYLEPGDGQDNSEYKAFEYRHTFCTANHTSAYAIQPGTRAFCSGVFSLKRQSFKEAEKGDNPDFNFLMLAVAASYPSDYTINKNAESIAEDSGAASDLVSQLVAWCATDDGSSGFNGDWAHDFNLLKPRQSRKRLFLLIKHLEALTMIGQV